MQRPRRAAGPAVRPSFRRRPADKPFLSLLRSLTVHVISGSSFSPDTLHTFTSRRNLSYKLNSY